MCRRLVIVGLLVVFAATMAAAQPSGVRYVYDALGRVVAVIDQNGEAAIYTYDAVGNVLSIARRAAGDVMIVTFSPPVGPPGTVVRISGIGFSEVSGDNAVSFNGTPATVTSAGVTELVVTVPAGATTGPISLVTPAGTSTSATPFVVTETVAPPTITSFAPTIGLSGTAVTVTGTGFDTVVGNNRLVFNTRIAGISGAAETELQTTVPVGGTSGRLKLTTPRGTVTSGGDFFVPPSPYVPTDVDTAARLTFGQPKTVSTTTPGHIGLLVFDGAPGRRVSMVLGGSGPTAVYSVRHPMGMIVHSASLNATGFMDVVNVPTSGTYTLMVAPPTAVGNVSLTLHDVPPDATATMTIGGPPVTVTTTAPGQNARLIFTGTAGQHVGIQASGVTIPSLYWQVRQSNGQLLTLEYEYFSGGDPPERTFLDLVLPEDDTYTVSLDPDSVGVGSATVAVAEIPSDITQTITAGGPPVTVAFNTPGQNARLLFNGQAGQRIALLLSNYTVGWETLVSIVGPNGLSVLPALNLSNGRDYRDTVALPANGEYTIYIDPQAGRVGNITATLFDVPPDLTGTLSIGGAPQAVTLATGQNGSLTFTGTAGQVVSLQMLNVSIPRTLATMRNPDGSILGQMYVDPVGGAISNKTLPTTGTYTVTLDPDRAGAGSMTLSLNLAGDIVTTITPGGPPVTVTIATSGQNARLLFQGVAGQKVSVKGTAVSVSYVTVSILNPDGTTLGSTTSFSPSGTNFLDTKTLPVTGTYTLFLDPWSSYTGSVTATLYDVVDVTGPIAIGGPTIPITLNTPGQTARLTFDAPANQRVSLRATSVTAAYGVLRILRPDGTTQVSGNVYSPSGVFIDATTLPVAGTYTVLADPDHANVGSLSVTLYDVTDVTGTISAGGPAVPVTVASPGQNVRLTFSGTAGQNVSVSATGVTISSSTLAILRPDGTTLASSTVTTSGGIVNPVALSVSGTYTVFLDPSSTNIGAASLALYAFTDVQGTITPGGPPVSLSITTPGQNARLTFEGAALQRVSVRATDVTIASATLALQKPDGTTLASVSVNTNGGFIDTQVLPVAGTYTVFVDPSGNNTGNITLTLYDVVDVTGTITPDGVAVPVTITTPGQNARLSFDGTAGQMVSVNTTAVSIASSTTVAILRPDGTTLASRTVTTSGGLLEPATLNVSGTYTLLLNPNAANTGSATLRLHNAPTISGTIAPGGSPVSLTLSSPGQTARLTFTGVSQQLVSLTATNVTIPTTWVGILRPNGTTLAATYAYTSGGFIDAVVLPEAGTYTVLIDPSEANTGNITVTLHDVVHVTGAIAIDGSPVSLAITTPGQNAILTFAATANQVVSLDVTPVTIGSVTSVAILRPDGATVTSGGVSASGGFLDAVILPITGTYTVMVNPSFANTGGATLTLYGVTDVTGTIVPGGASVPITITTPGQNAKLTFSAGNGQRVSLVATDVSIYNSAMSILRPDGTSLGVAYPSGFGGFLDTLVLTAAGTYTVFLNPYFAYTGSISLTLHNVVDVAGSVAINGGGFTIPITTPGQNASVTFSGTAGQQVTVRITGNSVGYTTVKLLRPDGSQQTSYASSASAFNLPQQTLGTTGTYTVTADPTSTYTGTLTISVTNP